MTEEQVTKTVLNALIKDEWKIIAFDFPQSGSGKMLHPNENISEKNKGGIVPDIVAVKEGLCLFFENKDRFVLDDFHKVAAFINENQYSNSISALLSDYHIDKILYGVAFPSNKWSNKSKLNASLVDFIIGVTTCGSIEFLHNPHGLVLF